MKLTLKQYQREPGVFYNVVGLNESPNFFQVAREDAFRGKVTLAIPLNRVEWFILETTELADDGEQPFVPTAEPPAPEPAPIVREEVFADERGYMVDGKMLSAAEYQMYLRTSNTEEDNYQAAVDASLVKDEDSRWPNEEGSDG